MLVSFLVSHPHRFGLLLPLLKRFFPLPYIVLRFSGLNFFSLQNSNSKYLITVIPNQFGWPVNKAAVFVLYIYILISQPSLDVFKLILHEKVLFWSSDSLYNREALRLLSYSCRYPGYQTNFLVCGEMLRHILDRRPKRPKEKKTLKFRVGSLYKDLVARSSVICTRGSFSLGT